MAPQHHSLYIHRRRQLKSHIYIISYRSGDYKDELVRAAAWLSRATNDSTYLSKAESLYNELCLGNWNGAFNWDNKITYVQVRYVE